MSIYLHTLYPRIRQILTASKAERTPWLGQVFRCVRPQFASAGHLLNAQGAFVAGGRWNPPGRFRVNYCSLSPGTAVEEAYRLFESKGLPRAIVGNRVIATIHYELQAVWIFHVFQKD